MPPDASSNPNITAALCGFYCEITGLVSVFTWPILDGEFHSGYYSGVADFLL
jgi:uncharacterized membrane protein